MLREEIEKGTELGKAAKVYMDAGELVPDRMIKTLLLRMFDTADLKNGFLLDGFPRTIVQAEALNAFLEKHELPLDKVFFLKVPKEVLIDRIAHRRACPACGATYHMSGKVPKQEGICDICGAALVKRNDDTPETVAKRIEVYNEQTMPLIRYYEKKGMLVELEGTACVKALQEQIDGALKAA
jgi:adenylate kinase